jgi:hypothetical protein
MQEWTIKIFVLLGRNLHINHIKGEGNWKYYSVLNVGTKNSKNVAVFVVGSLSCCNMTAQLGRQYRHIERLYSHVTFVHGFIDLFVQKHSHRFPVGDLPKDLVTNVVYGVTARPRYRRHSK